MSLPIKRKNPSRIKWDVNPNILLNSIEDVTLISLLTVWHYFLSVKQVLAAEGIEFYLMQKGFRMIRGAGGFIVIKGAGSAFFDIVGDEIKLGRAINHDVTDALLTRLGDL